MMDELSLQGRCLPVWIQSLLIACLSVVVVVELGQTAPRAQVADRYHADDSASLFAYRSSYTIIIYESERSVCSLGQRGPLS